MKFCNDVINQVLWTATDDMVYYNLPAQMIQHWTDVQQFNGTLVEIIKFLTTDFKVKYWPLRPTASRFEVNVKNDINNTNNTNTVEMQQPAQPMKRSVENDGWKTVKGKYKPKKQRSFSWDISSSSNRFDILKDNDDDFKQILTKDTCRDYIDKEKINETNDEIIQKEDNLKIMEEQYDVELVTNDALTALLESLNEEHVQKQQESNKIISSLKYDIVIKKDRFKKELDTVRSLNDSYKKQIKKGVTERKELESEKKEMEKKYKAMMSETSSMEAQLMMFQETLEQKDDLQRLCDQYLSKIHDQKKQMSDKDMDINRLKNEKETDKTEFLKLTKKYEKVKRENDVKDWYGREFKSLSPEEYDSLCTMHMLNEKKKRELDRQRSRYKERQSDR